MKGARMDYVVQTSKGPVRFRSVGEPIAEIPAIRTGYPIGAVAPWEELEHSESCDDCGAIIYEGPGDEEE